LSLSGDTPQPQFDQYRHYGYIQDAPYFSAGLRPGSFAAPASDPILSGRQAQALYSLAALNGPPNAYYPVTVQRGTIPVIGPTTVQPRPDFGADRVGGLNEVRFPEGTPPGSVGEPVPVPECSPGE